MNISSVPLRDDLQMIFDWITPNSRVLDLGCGDGELLAALVKHKNCQGYGLEINTNSVLAAMQRGINVIQADLEAGLQHFNDNSFDIIVLSQTIQSMQNTENILQEMKRVAAEAIVTFPNFGYWRNRLQIALGGHMPVSERMPYQWYNTPNIHWCTLQDFDKLCAKNHLKILQRAVMSGNKRISLWPNLLGSLAFYRVG
ncbi:MULTISPECIES: methionine biosynthesis protein MetW [Snodgrassella]|uniref:Methionine biosynthesis protein MetW n=1 Tax=Snodgrassella alvi TaxID=1196083 RepID=A0A1X0TJU0_9NEIS|nr:MULTISPECIES: methionine biosynthesis protein MetW [Snodgrassella]AHN28686.1 Methionine biosynthesis protein MetW [Snodgrassella alvi wkB2]MBI0068582.1 methionine biosynthesis protein MetW [Snodgrassella sp. M0110]MBI0077595.1 methionine biosynthesis protein MetW [Snodgrassella sp. M0118]MBI0080034.1 methionine biosynthesis protein MetW [Snodgrassella sp. M0112]MBI0129250.1 methionine biosynthesis protein MetW [Snodgrassella sp. W8124]